jgi:L-arabinonolactonase
VVRRYTPEGKVDRQLAVPVKNPSCVAFGGPELDTLFVTSARKEMTPQELDAMPQAGGVYRVAPGARGLLESRFRSR